MDELTPIIGEPKIIPIFREVKGTGNNAGNRGAREWRGKGMEEQGNGGAREWRRTED
jgi:ribosomal protein L39E